MLPFFRIELAADDTNGLTAFQDEYYRRSGMLVSLSYLQQARVVLFYVGTQRVGGYVINVPEWAPMRYMSYFSERLKAQILEEVTLQEKHFIELTCIWKSKTLPPAYSGLFYLSTLADARRIGLQQHKTHLIGGSALHQIRQLQRRLMPIDLFIGVLPDAGLTEHSDDLVAIYACELRDLPLRAGWLFLSRFVFRANWLRLFWKRVKPSSRQVGRIVTSRIVTNG